MALPATEDKREFVERMFDGIAPRYDLMNRLMTLGIDRAWRRRLLAGLGLPSSSTILDIGCGTGDLLEEAATRGLRGIGVDLSAGMLAKAAERVPGAQLLRADAAALPLPDASCDGAVSAFAVRNFVSVDSVLGELGRVLRPGGRLAILEVDRPASATLRLAFDAYFRAVVPLLGRALSRGYAYRYLSDSRAYLPSAAELESMLGEAGFAAVDKRALTGGAAQLVFATRRAANSGSAAAEGSTR